MNKIELEYRLDEARRCLDILENLRVNGRVSADTVENFLTVRCGELHAQLKEEIGK